MAETTILGVWCRVYGAGSQSCDNKAISAPRWGLAGWLGLSLAIEISGSQLSRGCDLKNLVQVALVVVKV